MPTKNAAVGRVTPCAPSGCNVRVRRAKGLPALPVQSSANQHGLMTHPIGLVANQYGLPVNPTGLVTNPTGCLVHPTGLMTDQYELFIHPIGLVTDQYGLMTHPTGLLINPTGLVTDPIELEADFSLKTASAGEISQIVPCSVHDAVTKQDKFMASWHLAR